MKPNYLDRLILLPTTFHASNQWLADHLNALNSAASEFDSEYERALVEQVVGWLRYADAYLKTTGDPQEDDLDHPALDELQLQRVEHRQECMPKWDSF